MSICSSLTSGDSGQLSGSKLSLGVASKLRRKEGKDVPPRQLADDGSNSRKTSDSGVGSHSPSPDLGSDSEKEGEEGGAHKITVFVKYTGPEGPGSPLVEGSVDSEEEREEGTEGRGVREVS